MSMRSQLRHLKMEDCKACTIKEQATLVVLVGGASPSLRCLSRAKLLSIRNPWRIRVNQARPRSSMAPRPSLPQLPSSLTLSQWWRLRIWSYRNFTIKRNNSKTYRLKDHKGLPLKQIRIKMTSRHSKNPTWSPSPRFSCRLGFKLSNSISNSCHPSQRHKSPKIGWSTWSTCL